MIFRPPLPIAPELCVARWDEVLQVLAIDADQAIDVVLLHVDAILRAHRVHHVAGEGAGVWQVNNCVVQVHHCTGVALLLGLDARIGRSGTKHRRRAQACHLLHIVFHCAHQCMRGVVNWLHRGVCMASWLR